MCVGMVLKLDKILLFTDMLMHRKPQPYRFTLFIPNLHPNFHKAMLIGLGVASTNHTDKFWHTGSAEEYSSEEFDG